MPNLSDILMPGRECGACTVCCKDVIIDTPELQKPHGTLCIHCVNERGCQIYETRPQACRSWYCGWRIMPQLDDSWRPDISEILVSITGEDVPASYKSPGLRIDLLGSLQKILWPPLVNLIGGAVENRLAIFLSVPGAPGFVSGKVFLNETMAIAHASRDWGRVRSALVQAANTCANRGSA